MSLCTNIIVEKRQVLVQDVRFQIKDVVVFWLEWYNNAHTIVKRSHYDVRNYLKLAHSIQGKEEFLLTICLATCCGWKQCGPTLRISSAMQFHDAVRSVRQSFMLSCLCSTALLYAKDTRQSFELLNRCLSTITTCNSHQNDFLYMHVLCCDDIVISFDSQVSKLLISRYELSSRTYIRPAFCSAQKYWSI